MERPSSPPDTEVDSGSVSSTPGPEPGAKEGDEGATGAPGLPPVKDKWPWWCFSDYTVADLV